MSIRDKAVLVGDVATCFCGEVCAEVVNMFGGCWSAEYEERAVCGQQLYDIATTSLHGCT